MALKKQNFFKDWILKEIDNDITLSTTDSEGHVYFDEKKVTRSGRKSRKSQQQLSETKNENLRNIIKTIERKSDNTSFAVGDCVVYQESNKPIETWYIYNISVDPIDKKMMVSGLRLIDWETLELQFSIKNHKLEEEEQYILNELILIPEIDLLLCDGSFEVLKISSFENYIGEQLNQEIKNGIDIDNFKKSDKYVRYLFDPMSKQLKHLEYSYFKKTCTGDDEAFGRFKALIEKATPLNSEYSKTVSSNDLLVDDYKTDSEKATESDKDLSQNPISVVNEEPVTQNKRKLSTSSNEFKESLTPMKKVKIIKGQSPSIRKSKRASKIDYSNFLDDEGTSSNPSDANISENTDEYIPNNDADDFDMKSVEDETENAETDEEFVSEEEFVIDSEEKRKKPHTTYKKNTYKKQDRDHKLITAASYANSYQKNHLSLRIKNNNSAGSNMNAESKDDDINRFKSQLSTSQSLTSTTDKIYTNPVDSEVPGREEEFASIYSRIASFVNSGVGSSIYISGVPGTGKSFTVKKTIECLLKQNHRAFSFAEINGLKLINLDDCYENLCDKLQVPLKMKEKAVVGLERFFSMKKDKKIVLLLDEIDVLLSHDSEKLYNFFNWPYLENSNLFVIAIGNRMNLSEQLNAKTNSRLGTSNCIQFSPYNVVQLETILKYRLSEECEKSKIYVEKKSGKVALFSSSRSTHYVDSHKSQFYLLKILFPSTSIQFLAKSGTAASSDVRTAKGIGLSAMELVEEAYTKKYGVIYNYEKYISQDDLEDVDDQEQFEVKELKVTTADISKAKIKSHSASVKDYVSALPIVSKFILFAAVEISNEYETNKLFFRNVIDKLDTLLQQYRDNSVLKGLTTFMDIDGSGSKSLNIRIIDWDFAVNQLGSSGLIEITRFSNERANIFTLKNKDGIEAGIQSFISKLR
ncbi:P-loop containing nucleoside triphosphate hydrolase protein [Hanseniaspora valbyensis NRRL Y-1626]|uniref:Origin recognition complex subunit 1 n=1 Tax=Hanseniaspora valbyensis NRRL Y-1626 TaxID=766949 RepID=A0A1B7TBW5_9ASCO|nr:P-loop containing nucleoside triphosphate hydrolase protein [Hanseniaspora valbyensis NRRL Y-1626]